jgi:hypothetical protein
LTRRARLRSKRGCCLRSSTLLSASSLGSNGSAFPLRAEPFEAIASKGRSENSARAPVPLFAAYPPYWILETTNAPVAKVPLDGGAPVTLATAQAGTLGLAVDDRNVYWTNQLKLTGSVASVPKAGGVVTTIASGQIEPLDVVVDSTSVYWGTADGYVMKAAKP